MLIKYNNPPLTVRDFCLKEESAVKRTTRTKNEYSRVVLPEIHPNDIDTALGDNIKKSMINQDISLVSLNLFNNK
jgi:hypothetical protein